jgi:hypothetical protein
MDGPPHPFRLELSSFLLCSGTVFLSSMWEESPTLVQHGILPPASMKREEELVVKSQSGERCCCRGSVAMSWECKKRGNQDSLMNTDRKKRRILLVTWILRRRPSSSRGCSRGSNIKENYCYGFEKREAAEVSIATGQNGDGIELPNSKQVRIIFIDCGFSADLDMRVQGF